MHGIPFTNEEKKTICNLWKQGFTATQICRTIESLNTRKPQTLYPILIKAGLYQKKKKSDLRKFSVDDSYFDEINTEHKAYWLGFMLADGFISNSGHATESFGITIKSTDRYLLGYFRNDLNATYNIHDYKETHVWGGKTVHGTVSKILIKSKKIFNKLVEMGFSTDKSHDAVIPYDYIPQNLMNHFVRGYFDGDGGFSKTGEKQWHTYSIVFTGTYEVISGIRHIFNKDNVKLCERHKDRDNNNYSLVLCGDKQCYNIGKWMYNNATIYLKRKYERYKTLECKYVTK